MNNEPKKSSHSYGKRPLWQWIVLYILIGAVVYGLIYYFVIANHGGYSSNSTHTTSTSTSAGSAAAPTSNIYTTKTDAANKTYIADFQGVALYVYDGDTAGGTSTCNSGCASSWPAYTSGATAEPMLPTNITTIVRADGTKQFAWKGKPLYYFTSDTQPGQTTGDGLSGFHLAR